MFEYSWFAAGAVIVLAIAMGYLGILNARARQKGRTRRLKNGTKIQLYK